MSRKIYLLSEDDKLLPLQETSYTSEDLLQTLLQNYPDLLAGDQMNEASPRRWLLVDREFGVPDEENGADRWALDHLFLDQDGIPTLVEVKRSTDTRIRREVVGQMLDYAANAVVYWPIESLRSRFELMCEAQGINAEEAVVELIDDKVEDNVDGFWAKVKTNLQAGRIRLVFVADEIPRELRRIVEFLNEQMDPAEVLAVEVKQFTGEGVKTLVPRVIGQTAEAQQKKSVSTRKHKRWDETSFFAELEANCELVDLNVARKLYAWGQHNFPAFWWGKGMQTGSCYMGVLGESTNIYPIALWTSNEIEIPLTFLIKKQPFISKESRLEYIQRLNEIPGIQISKDKVNRKPCIPFSSLRQESAFEAFIDVMNWFINEVSAYLKSQEKTPNKP